MVNKFLSYISDEHLLQCISNLHKSYINAKNKINKKQFYANKVDTFKLTFDSKFNEINEESLIESEMLRQIDKSINNFIGTFHEEVLGGVPGFQRGNLSGFDIKADDDSLFADIKNKHNTMNSSSAESLFQKLARYADTHKHAKCYWVQILSKGSFNDKWFAVINGKEYSHSRVYKISGDQFYKLVTGVDDAFFQLYKMLPSAIDEYLATAAKTIQSEHSALSEIKSETETLSRSLLDQITLDNFKYYEGFNKL